LLSWIEAILLAALLYFVLVLPQIAKLIGREKTTNIYRLMHLAARGRIDAERMKR